MGRRSYEQNCALARTADVIGERWTLLLVRDLLVGPRRFNELLASLKGIGSNLLAKRLKDLEAAGLLTREKDGSRAYRLTVRGRALEPGVLALIRWGLIHGPENREGDHHQDDWDLLALKAAFQPERAASLAIGLQFNTNASQGWVSISDGRMTIGRGALADVDVIVDGSVADLFLHHREPDTLLARGDPTDLRRFTSVFALRP